MKKQAVNPYLPCYEYIPDGEPHVFGERVYIYGSHDRFNAPIFCVNDYVCYSAPVNDLSDWKYEGVIYSKKQDPKNKLGIHLLFAPDVVQGPDGKYYLYYAYDFMGIMGVAVCDTPAGKYSFYGHVRYPNGKLWGRTKGDQFPFDPGVLHDDGRIYLYSGFYTAVPAFMTGFYKLKNDGGVVLELERDMLTIKAGPKLLFPKKGKGSFGGHEFFEASSIRKKDGRYFFVYSSVHNHELCYAVSNYPDRDFKFGGTLISQGDLFLEGEENECKALNYLGNNHGGIEEINGKWYIFYHRQTNQHSFSRQACAEKLTLDEDGNFKQAEVTSCGLNEDSLQGFGTYEARIACNLFSKNGVGRYDGKHAKKRLQEHPYFTQTGKDVSPEQVKAGKKEPQQYIANMRDGAVAGFKYFRFNGLEKIAVKIRTTTDGIMQISTDLKFENIIAEILVQKTNDIQKYEGECTMKSIQGVHPLYFRFAGNGILDFYEIELKNKEQREK